jgi:hypothetical protein
MIRGRFCEIFFSMSFSTPQSNREIHFRNKFSIPLCLSYENCKRPRRNHTSKRENCFAIFILVCNFHISLQFSYQFAILTFWCMVPTWTFAIFIWVCNFHMSLQFSYQFAILTSNCRTSYVHGFIRIPM